MKSLFFIKTKQLRRSVKGEAPTGIMIMTMSTCVLLLIALSGTIFESMHFDRDSVDVIAASRLAEEIARVEAEKTGDPVADRITMGPDGTEFCVEKRMIPGPPDGGPRLVVIVKWMTRGEEKQVYLTRDVDPDILTAAH
ncbi:MAG: hypothetical protein KOO63_12010 [Bacteroidales bacterium]|nr:hypothetical protein [Candidatus Latescibacterota bacterium]